MKKNRVFATAGLVLLAAGVLAACSSSKSSDSSALKLMAMFIQQIQKPWTT